MMMGRENLLDIDETMEYPLRYGDLRRTRKTIYGPNSGEVTGRRLLASDVSEHGDMCARGRRNTVRIDGRTR